MTIKQFIEKAVEGGYGGYIPTNVMSEVLIDKCTYIFLDPLAWQAVGKVEEWLDEVYCHPIGDFTKPQWQVIWHLMIDALVEGKTIEQFLATLSPEQGESNQK